MNDPSRDDLRPVASRDHLLEHWQWIKGPRGFDEPQVFAVVFDDGGRMLPTIINIRRPGEQPDPEAFADLVVTADELIESAAPRGSAAYLWARPGGGEPDGIDLAWLRALDDARSGSVHRSWPVLFATDAGVRHVDLDDVY